MLKQASLILVFLLVLAADQAAKAFLMARMSPQESIPVMQHIFHITLVFNTGCAFGLLKNISNLVFIGASAAAIAFFIVFLLNPGAGYFPRKLAASLIMSGAVSNLCDRLRFGHVVDFLDFRVWPVFNLGDAAITIGAGIFISQLCIRSCSK